MKKYEFKYLVAQKKLPLLSEYLKPYITSDKYAADRADHSYTVNSIYFDTHQLDFYHEKLAGLKKRKKLRIRGYNEPEPNSICFLEVKEKNGPIVQKTRVPVYFTDLNKLLVHKKYEQNLHFEEKYRLPIDQLKFFYHLQKLNLFPVLKIRYRRQPYFYKFNDQIRFTIDSNIGSSLLIQPELLYSEAGFVPAMPDSILEIKTTIGIPHWLHEIILVMGLQLQPLSKYKICLESISRYEQKLNRLITGTTKSYDNLFKIKRRLEQNYA